MSKCIGGVVNDSLGDLLAYSPGKSLGNRAERSIRLLLLLLLCSLLNFTPLSAETRLAYNRFRYYSPETGAYISQDPIRLKAGQTKLYAYVHDVNSWVDPWGLMPNWMKTKQGYQRHHIIPQSLQNYPLFEASGMNIDGASNMKYLPVAEGIDPNPNKAIHLGWNDVHKEYNNMMRQRMGELYDVARSEGWDKRRIHIEIIGLQTEVRRGLDSGRYKTH